MSMVKNRLLIGVLTLLMTIVSSTGLVYGQNLMDNQYMQQAREYRQQAKQALDAGNYDQAVELAAKAQEYTTKAEAEAQRLARMYRAHTIMAYARDRVDYVEQIGVAKQLGDLYTQAKDQLQAAQQAFEAEQYEQSVTDSRKVLSLLKDITPRTVKGPQDILPKYYTVRRGDCLCRIARYSFIYGDKYAWRPIYEANKQKLPQPDNPHLIYPGEVFVIPSRHGELRMGTY